MSGCRVAIAILMLALSALPACSYRPSGLESWPDEPSCGSYENRNEPVSAEQRQKTRCLLNAFTAGRPAELVFTSYTIEGDPITEYYRVLGPGSVEGFIDSTQDSFGSQEWTHMLCEGMAEGAGPLYGLFEECRQISVDEIVE